jgi:hypothetical protein
MKRTHEQIQADIAHVERKRARLFEELRAAEAEEDSQAEAVTVSWYGFEDIVNETSKGWVKIRPSDDEDWRDLECDNHDTCPNERTRWERMYRFKSLDGIVWKICELCLYDEERMSFLCHMTNRDGTPVKMARNSIEPELLARVIKNDEEAAKEEEENSQ